jgi:lipoprotein-releasing system permease protein
MLVMIIAALGIANAMSMRVMDKTPEIGMLMAVGAQRKNIMKIFLVESGLLGLLGSAAGCILALIAIKLTEGFSFEIEAAGREITTIPLIINPLDFANFSLMAIALCLLAGVYPAIQASRLDPVEAIKV